MKGKICQACKRNEIEVQLQFMPRGLCRACFARNIEHRVRHNIRIQHLIKKGSEVGFEEDSSQEARMLEYILKRLQKALPFKLKKEGELKLYSLDEQGVLLLDAVLRGRRIQRAKAPLSVVHSEEVRLFCKFKRLGGKQISRLNAGQQELLLEVEKLEQKHPQIKFSMLNFLIATLE